MKTQTLEKQLAKVLRAGLDSNPELRASLTEALSSSTPETKATKAEAKYREADSEEERCGQCDHYDPPDHCALVSGSIKPDDVCDYFEPLKDDDARTGR